MSFTVYYSVAICVTDGATGLLTLRIVLISFGFFDKRLALSSGISENKRALSHFSHHHLSQMSKLFQMNFNQKLLFHSTTKTKK